MTTTPQLGATVEYTHRLHRRHRRVLAGAGAGSWGKVWVPEPEQATRPGILIGCRTLSNGYAEYLGEGSACVWRGTEHFAAWLVAVDLRSQPVYVLPEHARLIGEAR